MMICSRDLAVLAAAVFLALSGCGGTSAGPVTTSAPPATEVQNLPAQPTRYQKFLARSDRYTALQGTVQDLSGTRYRAMPHTGSASFTGMARMHIDAFRPQNRNQVNMLGYAQVVADFGSDTVRGQISNIQGHNGATPVAGEIVNVDGILQIGNGTSQIGTDPNPALGAARNRFYADYGGTLQSDLGTITIAGGLTGIMRGTRVNQPVNVPTVKGIEAEDLAPQIVVDGTPRTGSVTIVAKN